MTAFPRSLRRTWRHLALVLAACSALGAQAAKISMEATAPTSVVGLLPQTMAPHWSKAGVDVELALGQTLTKSLLKMGQGSLDSAVVPLPAYAALAAGTGPYAQMGEKAKPLAANVRALFAFTASTFHPIVWADSSIRTWADVKGKRVYIGPPAGAANAQITALIKTASGLEEGKDYTGIKAPWGAAADSFKDGQFDVFIGAFGVGSQAVVEMSLARKIRLLSMPNTDAPAPRLGMAVSTIPSGTYPGAVNTEPVTAWRTLMMLAVNKDVSDEVAYQLTRTYFEQLPAARAANASLAVLSADDAFMGLALPLHPGALRYYREAGRSVPPALAGQ